MTKELLDQAYQLCKKLEKLCWQIAMDQNKPLYNRYKQLEYKSWARYERRFKKYWSNN
jgi:hypothetical protein